MSMVQEANTGLFSNLDFFKRTDIVKPYLHSLDVRALNDSVLDYLGGQNVLEFSSIQKLQKSFPELNLDKNKFLPGEFEMHFSDVLSKIPRELINDCYNLFYSDIKKLEFNNRDEKNATRYKFLDKAMDPILSIIGRGNPLKSMVVTRYFMQYIVTVLTLLKLSDPENFDDFMDQLRQKPTKQRGGMPGQGNIQGEEGEGSDNEEDEDYDDDYDEDEGPQDENGDLEEDPVEEEQDDNEEEGQYESDKEYDSSKKASEKKQKISKKISADLDTDKMEKASQNTKAVQAKKSTTAGIGNSVKKGLKEQFDKTLKRFIDTPDRSTKKLFEDTMKEAKDMIKSIDDTFSSEEIADAWKKLSIPKNTAEKEKTLLSLNPKGLELIRDQLKSIRVSMGNLTPKIKHLLDKSASFFSSRETTVYEPLIDAGEWSGLDDWELLHPKIRNIMLMDIDIKEVKKMGKINAYVDVSGSMSSSCGVLDPNGKAISCLTFAKSVVFKMKELDLLNRVYSFEYAVHPEGNTLRDILTIDGDGGTNLNNVVKHVKDIRENALIVTDACDSVNEYSEHAFFIGVMGANFSRFSKEVKKKYIERGQLVLFDGVNVINVTMDM